MTVLSGSLYKSGHLQDSSDGKSVGTKTLFRRSQVWVSLSNSREPATPQGAEEGRGDSDGLAGKVGTSEPGTWG